MSGKAKLKNRLTYKLVADTSVSQEMLADKHQETEEHKYQRYVWGSLECGCNKCLFSLLSGLPIIFLIHCLFYKMSEDSENIICGSPGSKLTSLNVIICPTSSPNPKDSQFAIMKNSVKQQILDE